MRVGDIVTCIQNGNIGGRDGVHVTHQASLGFGIRGQNYRVTAIEQRPAGEFLTLANLEGTHHGKGNAIRFRLVQEAPVVEARPQQPAARVTQDFVTYQVIYRNRSGGISQFTYQDEDAARQKARDLADADYVVLGRKKITVQI